MRKTYRGTDVEVTFDLDICIHVGECLRGEPAVFQLKRRPWVLPDAGRADAIAEVIHRCPSGALQYRRLDGGPAETHEGTTATPIKNGPLLVIGDIDVRHEDGTVERLPRATLCRCGQSRNKPFCDNEHLRIKFEAPGAPLKIHLTPVRPREDEPIKKADDPRG
jgi:uncharacterized Fe-S cluster protein YjdI/CDGSH-type Zn-finger protein